MRGRDGELVQLDALATRRGGRRARAQLNHYNRVRSSTLIGQPGARLHAGRGARLADRDRGARCCRRAAAPRWPASRASCEESGAALYFAFVLALVVVFMVLAAQFESLVHPFTVLLAVPLAVTGALLTLWLAGSTLNLYSQIGMILLIGLVTKNSILLVEYTNQLRSGAWTTVDARARGRAGSGSGRSS